MKDTEIKVNGKCVGEYDMCPDAPVIFMDFEPAGDTVLDDSIMTRVTICPPDKLSEAFKRNMTLHVICTTNHAPNGSGSYQFELKFPFIKDTKGLYPSSGIMDLVMLTSLLELGIDYAQVLVRLPFVDYEKGEYTCDDNEITIKALRVGDNKIIPNLVIHKIYATEY